MAGKASLDSVLSQVPLFSSCNAKELKAIARLTTGLRLAKGTVVTRQGVHSSPRCGHPAPVLVLSLGPLPGYSPAMPVWNRGPLKVVWLSQTSGTTEPTRRSGGPSYHL